MSMRIGEIARSAGVSAATVRYYERRGLLEAPARGPNDYRRYSADAVTKLRFVKHAQRLGFTLGEIRELLALRVEHGSPCEAVMAQAATKVAELEGRIAELTKMKEVLDDLVAACRAGRPTGDCPILEVLERGRNDEA